MFCRNCGKEIDETSAFCPHCGTSVGEPKPKQEPQPEPPVAPEPEKKVKYCANCGKEIDENAVICVHCGATAEKPAAEETTKKKINAFGIAGFVVSLCSLFISIYCIVPVTGLVLSIVGMNNRKTCTSCNGLAIAGFVIGIVAVSFKALSLILSVAGCVTGCGVCLF